VAGGEARGSGSPPMSAGATYAGAGVDIGAGDLAVERMKGLVPGIGGFGAQFPLDTTRFTNPVLVSSTDGVGTKLTVAQATGRYDTIGLDLVAMCVDDLVCLGAEPLFMLDYIATGKVDPDRIATVVQGIQDGCRQARCVLIGGETAEHPGVMAPDDLDIAGFAVGAVESASMLGPDRVDAGDVIIGIPSPGLRSNGYTLARHVLLERAGRSLGDPAWSGATHTLADELLLPSVIYTPAVLAVRAALDAAGGDDDSGYGLHACAHITGGGIVGNLPRVLPQGWGAVLDRAAWVEPQIFVEIQRLGSVEEAEMDRVFNRGVGMALVVAAAAADAALAALAEAGLPSTVIGAVVEAQEGVVIR
jgi:phosphoribosylformylglycinamidine cyclo-ligase